MRENVGRRWIMRRYRYGSYPGRNLFSKNFSSLSYAEKFAEFNGSIIFEIRQKRQRYRGGLEGSRMGGWKTLDPLKYRNFWENATRRIANCYSYCKLTEKYTLKMHMQTNVFTPVKFLPTTISAEFTQLVSLLLLLNCAYSLPTHNFTGAPASSRRCHHQPRYEFWCLSIEFVHSSYDF